MDIKTKLLFGHFRQKIDYKSVKALNVFRNVRLYLIETIPKSTPSVSIK